jgi:hypothetical protein
LREGERAGGEEEGRRLAIILNVVAEVYLEVQLRYREDSGSSWCHD